ncbi:CpsD/CapB family tyrosine-protein kinase [Bacillus sp. S/N-304-OC-R1]|uniref:CpsD/CapB family tyrosine-protein kinase n=1 Tax=Bacillus sp. S/N-304-OC-R1 TaxID=2758034 RepID=UPI0028BD448B|nr:CpsD/CapB family tyrosine-protein kinase [Bacillus sp. S/N-304-OC-R1]
MGLFTKKEKIDSREIITMKNPKSPISEQYRTIRTNIEYSNIDRENRMIMITSSSPGEGKTVTTVNLAIVFAQQGKKVLLIDADFRKPKVHEVFKKSNIIGLTTILIKQTPLMEAIKETKINNLYVLTSGPLTPNPSELLSSKSLRNLLAVIRKEFDFIIIDTPPILAVTDAQILANQCDGVILVINYGKTKFAQAEKAKNLLMNVNARILGVILNKTKGEHNDDYYYYYK